MTAKHRTERNVPGLLAGQWQSAGMYLLCLCCYRQLCGPVEALWSLPLHGWRPLLCALFLPRGLFLCWDLEPWLPASTLLAQLHQAPGTPTKAPVCLPQLGLLVGDRRRCWPAHTAPHPLVTAPACGIGVSPSPDSRQSLVLEKAKALPFLLCDPNLLPCTFKHITDLPVVMCL